MLHFDLVFLYPLVRAVCFMGAKEVRPANWYGSKNRMERLRVVLNALGSFVLRALPVVKQWMK